VLELGEAIEEGLVREVEEETGLRVRPRALTGVYKNLARGIVALVFHCEVAGQQVRSTTEAPEIRWLTAAEVVDLMTDAYAVRLLDAQHPGPPRVRAHDGTHLIGS
jgi:8-oxo-dGTP diphosphatase